MSAGPRPRAGRVVTKPGLVRGLPAGAYAAALASLPGVGPAWLAGTLGTHGPERAWELVLVGELRAPARGHPSPRLGPPARLPGLGRDGGGPGPAVIEQVGAPDWVAWARQMDVAGLWARCVAGGVRVTWPGSPGYPAVLVGGPAPPGVLFQAGRAGAVGAQPAVALVGTRRCTPDGAAVAYKLGYDLSRAGVCVVSGLALGVDGAGHAGALAAVRDAAGGAGEGEAAGSTVGVSASGVDVVYPRQHAALWREVVRLGAVVAETPPGLPAQAWRFPSRNRVIAGLAQMVVVVECHAGGGSWHTVEAAIERGIEVGAVPGSVHSSASVGTNTLLHEGAVAVRNAEDVLDVLSVGQPPAPAARRGPTAEPDGPPSQVAPHSQAPHSQVALPIDDRAARRLGAAEERVLAAVGWRPRSLDEVVERSGLPLTAAVVALDRLERGGLVRGDAGWWVRGPAPGLNSG